MAGPAGTGKSRACLEKLHHMAMLNPGMKGLIVRKNLSTLASTALQSYRRDVAAQNLADGDVRWFGGSSSEPAAFRYDNGSILAVGGMDKATKIMSSEYDVAYVQEAIELTENDWESITTRLRNGRVSFQQLIADTNPSTPTHWLKARVDRGQTVMLESAHEENPVLFDDDGRMTERGRAYLGKLDQLTGVRYMTLRKGLWVAAEGLVYDELNPSTHFIDRFTPPDDWARYWAIDFGFTNPFVCQFWAEDPDGRAYLYREVFMSGRTVDQHAEQIMRTVCPGGELVQGRYVGGTWCEPRPRTVVADPANAGDRALFQKTTGLPTKGANKAVENGVQAVQRRFKPAADGRPRIYFMRDVVAERDPKLVDAKKPASTVEELPGYVWDKSGGKPKETPVKENDHGMDAMRYFVMERETGGINRVRIVG
jgi:phage terminase large subunit